MKRFIRITLIVLLIIGLFLLGAWFIARHKAAKEQLPAPSFKTFLGIGTSTKPVTPSTSDDTMASDFTTPPTPGSQPTTTPTNTGPVTRTSIFTSGGFTPATTAPREGTIIENGYPLDTGGSSGGGSGGINQGGNPSPSIDPPIGPTSAVPECTEADVSIEFTPEEIARLNVLKTQFFSIAQNLNTDADVATELSNYDLFKTKSAKITELYNYCRQSPAYTQARATVPTAQPYGTVVAGPNGATINYRVPTPFWHDLTKDNQAFTHQGNNWVGIFSDPDSIFPERSIEHALRLNLW